MQHLDELFHLYMPARHTCDGTEGGVCTATISGVVYTFMIGNAQTGDSIIFADGKFYTDNPDMIVDTVQNTIPEPVSQPTETQHITFDEMTYYGSLPEGDEDVTQITYIEGAGGSVVAGYTKDGAWHEIPLITSSEVSVSATANDILELGQVNVTENGDIVEVS